jgi:predicted AAA+ superfamily ATPase
VGKTYAVRELGKTFSSMVEVNFEFLPEAKNIFDSDLDPNRIIWELGLLTKTKIIPGETLLFLDEVQAAPNVILALRYFYEKMPELHVIAAGSLIDFALEQVGMPVGRVTMLYIYPLSFLEFLCATGNALFIEPVLQGIEVSGVIHDKITELLSHYLVIGGMPEAVMEWVRTKNPETTRDIQKQLIETYRADFPKYARKHQLKYLEPLFAQIPHFIGEQFKYSSIHGCYKKRELAPCLDLLCHANVVLRITHSAGHGVPLGSEVNLEWFKTIFLDVGLSMAILELDLNAWFLNPDKDLINRGAIVEAFVGQELLCYSTPKWKNQLYFWKRDLAGATAEVDYLYDYKGIVVPIEVKSGVGTTLRSMHQFLSEHETSPYGIRFWSQNYMQRRDKLESRPLYAVATLADDDQIEAIKSLL